MRFEWLVGVLLLPCASLLAKKTTAAASSKWWVAIPHRETNEVTGTAPVDEISGPPSSINRIKLLNKSQRKTVRTNSGSMQAIATAVALAVNECRYQFRLRRWNCPTNTKASGQTSLFGKILLKGFRETAFIYAITTAAVTHSVARACSEGSISTCSCDERDKGPSGEDWDWGGCSDNAVFGHRFAKKFVDAGERGRDSRNLMNIHNNEAGRKTVLAEMKRECKCHGMSGSCTIQTCWMRLPSFRTVGALLKDRFDGASKIVFNNNGNPSSRGRQNPSDYFEPFNPNHKRPSSKDLVYFEDSPDFCERNPRHGTLGTVGRICNNTSLGMDGCDLMCCNRGYVSEMEQVKERCKCTFKWCCEVHCLECDYTRTVHRCV
uniref:Protein Wnt n=1 Tax=Holothuria glaberrima TaxID=31192 RepID=A0AA48SEZ1_HOLGL|nr:TPA_inf: Wnt1 [Holothuria glaberrima]